MDPLFSGLIARVEESQTFSAAREANRPVHVLHCWPSTSGHRCALIWDGQRRLSAQDQVWKWRDAGLINDLETASFFRRIEGAFQDGRTE